jgi:hypothetical protein
VPREEEGAAQTGMVTSENETSRARRPFVIELQPVSLATAKRIILLLAVYGPMLLVTEERSSRRHIIKCLQEDQSQNTE